MARGFEIFDGLASQHPQIPEGSVASRLILSNPAVEVVLVGLAPGETLSEKNPDQPSIVEVWRGEGLATIRIDGDSRGQIETPGEMPGESSWSDFTTEANPEENTLEEVYQLGPGTWLYLDAGTAHTIQATTEMVLLLTLLKGEKHDNA